MKKIKVGIVGAAGYTGGELIRLLINHPQAEIVFAQSNSNAGNFVFDVHNDLFGDTELKFSKTINTNIDVLFLCVGHGLAKKFLSENEISDEIKIIDLSQDFRNRTEGNDFVYGLCEWNRENIKSAKQVANPGCFATCIQLALLPIAAERMLNGEVHISATTGSTGAGHSLSETSHFSRRNNNLSTYKVLEHQHLGEILQGVLMLQNNFKEAINFIPHRGNFTRGIFSTLYVESEWSEMEAIEKYKNAYANEPFVFVSKETIDLKQVANTNKCLIHVEKHGSKLVVTSIIDNLLKGASGQALQNMNIMFGIEETAGLKLKAIAF